MAQEEQYQIPVFLINGQLDSGKTSFISDTIEMGQFEEAKNKLLIVCEEGEEEYDEKMLKNIQHAREDKADILDKLQNISSHRIPSSGFGVGNSTELFFEVLKQEDIWNLDIQKIFVDIRGLKR